MAYDQKLADAERKIASLEAENAGLRAGNERLDALLKASESIKTGWIEEVARLRARPTEEEVREALHKAFFENGSLTGMARAVIAKFPKVQP